MVRVEVVRALAKKHGMPKDKHLAERMGIHPGQLSRIFKGKAFKTDPTLRNMCKALRCQPGDVLEYIPDDDELSHLVTPTA